MFSDLVVAVLALAGATVTGWAIYRIGRYRHERFLHDIDMALLLAGSKQRHPVFRDRHATCGWAYCHRADHYERKTQ